MPYYYGLLVDGKERQRFPAPDDQSGIACVASAEGRTLSICTDTASCTHASHDVIAKTVTDASGHIVERLSIFVYD
jgi:hypothetical protein